MANKVSLLSEKSAVVLTDDLYLVDNDATPDSKRIGLDRLFALIGAVPGGRLTLTTAVPVTTADVTGASTIYYTPYIHNYIVLHDGTRWVLKQFSEVSLALSGLTSGKPYDVFLYDDGGTLTLELAVWTNDTTRAVALTRVDGILVKGGGATTRRYLGTLYTTATTTTEDSAAKRYLWNMYNRVPRFMKNVTETANTWDYTLATFRQANANAANQLDYIVGVAEDRVTATVLVEGFNTVSTQQAFVGVGVDSTSVNSAVASVGANFNTTIRVPLIAHYTGIPGVGRHILVWLEASTAAGTARWSGDGNQPTLQQSGIFGEVAA